MLESACCPVVGENHLRALLQLDSKANDVPAGVLIDHDCEEGTVLHLRVAPDDLGKIIGRQGRTARSMRTIVAAAGFKNRKRYALEIADPAQFPSPMPSLRLGALQLQTPG